MATGPQPAQQNLTHLGGFELLQQVGQGGMGRVYRARQLSLDRTVALKVLTPQLAADPKYTDSFLREARSAARLQHPNIVAVFDAGKADGLFYYAMEFVRGETLDKWVRREGALPESTVLGIGVCIANALKHAWDKEQIIHRDVKPENVMVDADGNVKLCDLGLAKNFSENTQLSLSGQVFGTPQYMSPEQSRAETVDFRTDIYSLGMTIYYALTAQIPFHGGTPAVVMARHMTEQLPDPRQFNPQISSSACRLLEKMLAKNPDDRYATWDDALRDLERTLAGQPPQSQPLPPGKSSVRLNPAFNIAAAARTPTPLPADPRGKSKMPLAIGSAAAILVTAVAAIYFISNSQPSKPPAHPPPHTQPPLVANPLPDPQPQQQNPPPQQPPALATAAQRLAEAQAFLMGNPQARDEFVQRLRALIADFPNSAEAVTAHQLLGEPPTVAPADPIAHAQAVRAFFKFKTDFLAALARRNYEEAEMLARAAARQPELQPMRATVEQTSAIPPLLAAFFKSFPAHFGKLKGRSFRASDGNTGLLVDVQDNQMIWHPQLAGAITIPLPVPMAWRDLKNPDAWTLAVAAFGEGDANDSLNLAWFAFSIGQFDDAMTRLEMARTLGADIAAAQRLMNALSKPQESDAQAVFNAARQLAEQQKWAEARELIVFLRDQFAATQFVGQKDADIASLDAQISESDQQKRRTAKEAEHQRQLQTQRLIEQHERQARLRAASDRAFGDFSKSFLALLAARKYADAEKLARMESENPAAEPLKEKFQQSAAAAATLQQFWRSLMDNAATFKGRDITLQNITGTLVEISDRELVLERNVGDRGVVGEEVPWSKLSTDEALALAPRNNANNALALAWFYFAEGKIAAAHSQLTKLPATDGAAAEARQLMTLLQQGTAEDSAKKLAGDLRAFVDAKKWAEARVTMQVLRENYASTKTAQSLTKELAEWEVLIAAGETVTRAPAGSELRTFEGHKDNVLSVAFSPDGRFLLSASKDKTMKLWDLATGQEARTFKDAAKWWVGSIAIAFTPDGRFVVSGNSEKQLKLWETATARPLWSIETKAGEISAVAVSPDGTIIAVGGSEKSVHLYAVADGKWMKSFEMSESKIRDVAFSADGRLVWAAGQDGVVRAWDAATGRESCSWRSQTGWGGWRSIAFSPDNKMALAAFEKELRLYETATGQLVRLFKGHDGTVRSVAFTPDGRHIVSGADDKTVRLWETATAKEIRVMRGHGKMVLKVAVSPDGRFAASASEDDTVRLWKLWDDAPDTPAPPRSDNPVRPQQGGFGATSGAAAHKRSGESIDEA